MTTSRWESAAAQPTDQIRLAEVADYDFSRPLYRCTVCIAEGQTSMHKYVDECPFFDDREPSSAPPSAE